MGTLQKFLGSSKEVDIDGIKMTIKPLKVKDMKVFLKKNPTEEESQKIGKELILLSIDGTNEEEIDNLSLDKFTKIINEINILNGFKDEDTTKIQKFIKQRESGEESK